jgi:curved DNA binding protein
MVKIDLGTHIDGYIALSAHTLVVGHVPNPSAPITGPRANVIHAAWTAANVAAKLIRPGNTNAQVTEAIKKITEAYGVKAIVGGIIHQMKRYVIEVTTKQAILRDDIPDHKVDACTFEPFEVYALDIAMSSGKGMPRDMSARTTVYRRKVDVKYGLRNKASRAFFNDVNKVAPTMPFSLRMFSDEKSAKLGVRECVSHDLLAPYPVVYEHDGDVVAHVKFTVLLLASGNSIITGLPVPEGFACPDVTLPEDIQTILAQEDKKAAKKKAAKAAAAGGAGK